MVRIGRLRSCFKWGSPLLIGLVLVALGLAVFVGLAHEVIEQEAFGFDQAILTGLAHAASPGLTRFMLYVSDSATPLFLVPVLVVLALLWWRRRRYDWLALAVSLAGAALLNQFVKQIFERTRPSLFPHLQNVGGYSLPQRAQPGRRRVLCRACVSRCPPCRAPWRVPIYVAAGGWIILVGLSRNYLEVHYPSDVIAAFAVTLPWVLAVIFVHQCYAPPVAGEDKVIEPAAGAGPVGTGDAD